MSLKDLLGLFDGKKQSDGLNVSLEQGSKFNSIQSRIEASVIPQLSIIEQTPGLGSVIENFSGNSPEAPLGQVNSAEYKEMTALENDFNKAVSTYSQKQNALMGAAQQSSRGKGWSWSVIKDHIMWSGEKNPKECAAACNADSSCTAWETCNNGKSGNGCQGCYLINKPDIAPPSDLNDPKWLSALANRELSGTIKAQADAMFTNLQKKAKTLQEKTMSFHGQNMQLVGENGSVTQQKASNLKQLQQLQYQQGRLNKLMTEGDTLNAIVHDNNLQMHAEYMRYFVWLTAAITLGLVAFHRASK